MYKRKTTDEFVIQGNYGQGWEDVSAYMTRKERQEDFKLYQENEPQYAHRKVTRRIKIEAN